MLDTIVYIPTILAYAFITLLIVILGFIVIYISHKIYISVYDNLPVPDMRSSTYLMDKMDNMPPGAAKGGILQISKHASMNYRKTKTALRIIVTLEPCYLAYVVYAAGKPIQNSSITTLSTAIATETIATCPNDNIETSSCPGPDLFRSKPGLLLEDQLENILVKYFDRLIDIPRGKLMETCPKLNSKLSLSIISSVFDSVVQNTVLARKSLTMPTPSPHQHSTQQYQIEDSILIRGAK